MTRMRTRAILWLAIAVMTVLGGCGFDNTMYNARKYFKAAQARPLTALGKPNAQAIDEYTKTIKKCGYILTERKNSPEADDALFLLAEALYYKGNSQFQAKDQFESLIRNFPTSPYVPESYFFIARIDRQINKPADAYSLLESYILNPGNKKTHAAALFLLADFAIQDKDYVKAQYWLEKILTDYPKTKEYKEAFYLSGKLFYDQKDYKSATNQFQKLISAKGIAPERKLDARYYLAMSLFEQHDYTKVQKMTKKLINDEFRTEQQPLLLVLKGRVALAQHKEKQGVNILLDVTKSYGHTLASSEAYYRLAEHAYYQLADMKQAGEYYGKSRQESTTAPWYEESGIKQTAITQIGAAGSIKPQDNAPNFMDSRLAVAENFLSVFDQPDSALVYYRSIETAPQYLSSVSDTIRLQSDSLQTRIDSLSIALESLPLPDSTLAVAKPDSTNAPDSLAQHNAELAQQRDTLTTTLTELKAQHKEKLEKIDDIARISLRFQEEYIPFSIFVKANNFLKIKADTTMAQGIYADMQEHYPGNAYTRALGDILAGLPVDMTNPELAAAQNRLDTALANMETAPDSAVVELDSLAVSPFDDIHLKANFRLGWHYTFEAQDTTRAKPYLDSVLEKDREGQYGMCVLRFYDGTTFHLIAPEVPEPDTTTVADSTAMPVHHNVPPRFQHLPALSDSSKAVPDSLQSPALPPKESNDTPLDPDDHPVTPAALPPDDKR